MVKYRALTLEELSAMEDEFVKFLVLNGIPGDDWVKLKNTNPAKAEAICESFSDVVFTKILSNARYLERHAAKEVVSIFCDDTMMYLQGIEAPDDLDVDFTDPIQFHQLKTVPPEGLLKTSSTKKYADERELEIWKMLNQGFFIADQKLYMALFEA